jgi:hypothetical protein
MNKMAIKFWEEVISTGVVTLKKAVRWDIFEENVIAHLLDKMNFSNDLLHKINWKIFL